MHSKIELQYLNPNRMLHIAGFVTLCEAFLGIDPHMDLFQDMFVSHPVGLKWDAGAAARSTSALCHACRHPRITLCAS